jgi:hypothetical protein
MCRTGCLTKDHGSWGECAKAANLRIGWMESGLDATAEKSLQNDLKVYQQARADGLQPNQSTAASARDAYRVSDMTGRAYDGNVHLNTSLVPDKRVAAGAVEVGLL